MATSTSAHAYASVPNSAYSRYSMTEALVQQNPEEVSSDQPQLTVVVIGESQLGDSGGTWD